MLTKEEVKQALYLNLKNHDWKANPNFLIYENDSSIILELLEKEYDKRFDELHG